MTSRRLVFLSLGAGALAAPLALFAQPPAKVWRIGHLEFPSRKSVVDRGRYAALIQGLREHGYVENKNFVFEARFADGHPERLDGLAQELVRAKVDLILSTGTPASHAIKRATSTIPIVITTVIDPVGDGFATSLARPGGNITGLSSAAEDTVQKLVELTAAVVPKTKRFAVLTFAKNSTHPSLLTQAQAAARKIGAEAFQVNVLTAAEIEQGFARMAQERADAVVVLLDGFLLIQHEQIAGLAMKHRLPSAFQTVLYDGVGGLMSFGPDTRDNFRRVGALVDKILKGAKPGEIPFEQPTRYYFVISRKTANQLGIKLSNEVLARADRVIE